MAKPISFHKVFDILGLLSLLLMMQKGGAYEFKVGGSRGWTVPSDSKAASYNHWAETNRFQVGDSLVFDYSAHKDSVLQVIKDDYTNCNTEAPLNKHTDGHTVFPFSQSGAYYFISGVRQNCLHNEKMVVVVMADRSKGSENAATSSISKSFIGSIGGAFLGSSLLLLAKI
ncbi:mavicyanin-like [Diospyros lotus]|uniref:mavicyanin-like n=1 Tax=Diospyros lotus TaxID=55363 RepID=UPI00224D45B6|nr:mavicyanin-like [Diospyros lotus]